MKSSRQQKQNSFHFVFENVSYVALCAHSSDCFKVQNNTLCETNKVLLLQWHVRLRRRIHNYDACLDTSHTHIVKYIFCLSFTLLSHCLCRSLAPSVLLFLFILSACLCFSLPASRWICGGVNRDAIPALLLLTHTRGVWFADAPV